MDKDDDIDINALIAEWDALQIRATGIVRGLEAAEARRTSRADAIPSNAVSASGITVNGLKVGNRVRIKNKVIKPSTWPTEHKWVKEETKLANVTRVSREQIHFITDNGIRTWRAPSLRRAVRKRPRPMSSSVSSTAASTVSGITEATTGGRPGGRGRGGRRNRAGRGHSRNSTTGTTVSRPPRATAFKGSTAEMNGHVFECFEEKGDRRQYSKTLEALKAYMQKTMVKYSED